MPPEAMLVDGNMAAQTIHFADLFDDLGTDALRYSAARAS